MEADEEGNGESDEGPAPGRWPPRIDEGGVGAGLGDEADDEEPQPGPDHDPAEAGERPGERDAVAEATGADDAPFGLEHRPQGEEIDDRDRRQDRQEEKEARQPGADQEQPSEGAERMVPGGRTGREPADVSRRDGRILCRRHVMPPPDFLPSQESIA